jgi:hypothetical protein
MSDPIAPAGHEAVRAAIRRAADATGVNFSLLVETARRESALDPHARAATSSATGLFQFIESTWLDMVRRHGADHGLFAQAAALRNGANAETRREILALRSDPEISARMAGELARENAATLQARLGRTPTAGELYAAHVMGPTGALRLIEAAQHGAPNAATLFPREAAANRGAARRRGGKPAAQSARSAQRVCADEPLILDRRRPRRRICVCSMRKRIEAFGEDAAVLDSAAAPLAYSASISDAL